jgi:hypothetical protein
MLNVALDEVHGQPPQVKKATWAEKLNNAIMGAERGFKQGLHGQYGSHYEQRGYGSAVYGGVPSNSND